MAEKTARTAPDWERIEANFRAGVMSLREIAAADGNVTEGAIRKRAKKEDWARDLSQKIKAKAEALVRKDAVRSAVRSEGSANERETIDANAQAVAAVKLGHRTDIRAGRSLVAKLLEELRGVTERPDLVEDLIQALSGDEDDDKKADRTRRLREALDRLMSLPGRVAAVKGLAEALRHLIGLEREAWGIDDKVKDPSDLDDLSDDELDRRIEKRLAKVNAAT